MDITTYKVCKNLVNNVLINGGGADLSDYAKKNHAHTEYTTEQDVKDIIEENGGTGGNVDLTGYVKEEQLDNYAEKDHEHDEYAKKEDVADSFNFFTVNRGDGISTQQAIRDAFTEFVEETINGENKQHLYARHYNPKTVCKVIINNTTYYMYLTYETPDYLNIYDDFNTGKYTLTRPEGEEELDYAVIKVEIPPLDATINNVYPDTINGAIIPGFADNGTPNSSKYCSCFATLKEFPEGGNVDLTGYVKEEQLDNYAEKDHVHDKYTTVPAVIQLIEENCKGGTFDPTGTVTEEDLEEYAKKEDLEGYAKTYTSLDALELTSSATINEVISKLSPGEIFTCGVLSFSNYQTMFPYFDSSDRNAYVFIHRGESPITSYAKWYKSDGSSEALAQFNALTGYIGGWNTVSTRKSYVSLTQLGLTADATITQVVNAMLEGERFRSIVTRFNNYQTMFPYEEEEDQNAYVLIDKLNGNAVYAAWYRIDGTKHYIGNYTNNTLQNWVNYSPTSDLSEGTKTYTSLTELGLTADAAFQDVVDKLPKGGSALLGVKEFTNYQTIFPYEEGNDQFSRVHVVKGVADGSGMYARWFRKDGVKEAIAIFNINDNTFSGWRILKDQRVYTSLSELGLTSDATVEDVVNTLKNGESFLAPVNTFTNYETIFPNKVPNDQWNKIHIIKGTSLASSHIRCFSPSGTFEYLANINNTNIVTWNDVSGTYTDISDTVIEKLGNEILKYPVGKYRINSTATGNKFTDLPSDAEMKCGLIEINGTAVGKSPFTDTWVYRMYKFECLTGTLNYIRRLNSGATAGQVEVDTGWQQIHTKKEDDSYIPNVYDRNANGDMPVVPFDRLANYIAVRSNRGLVSTTETEATYDEDYVGGYVFSGANDVLIKDKEMFNKIKVLVHIPGVLRIGIVNEKIYEANPRYSTCLVKWLVADFVAFTGMKEYDIADTVLEEGQSIFLECRTGVSSWYLNTGEETQVGAVTYPANSCTTGLRVADKLDSTTNNILFKSQKVNSSSCLIGFGSGMYSIGGKIRGNFRERAYDSGANSSKKADENLEYFGGLNVGLYRRTKYSDTRICKCIENGMNNSWVGDDNVTKIYAPYGQERIVGKSVYAFKLDVRIPGNLTIYHLKGKSLDAVQVIDKYTHYVRAVGLQTIHLPFDIKINSTDEYIGFGGFHCKSTSDNIVKHSCQWCYLDVSQATWMTTIDNGAKQFYSIGVSNTVYPEKFTSFETNPNYVNIELICRGEKRSPLEDKYISFTGDSITTYTGFCTTKNGYPEGNPAGDNAVYYPASGKVVNNVDATWWGILAKDNRMKILRNDAWSGSRVSSTEGSTDTKCLCGTKRRYYLRNGYDFATNSTHPFGRPEIIVSMIGTNDLSGGIELGEEMFTGVTGAEEEYKTILSAFALFCRRIYEEEGKGGAKIVHFLIPRGSELGYANANGVTIADLSLHFERIANAYGQYFIPLSYFSAIKPGAHKQWSCPTGSMFKNTSGIEFPSGDGLHPNAKGMEAIADGVHRFLCSIM